MKEILSNCVKDIPGEASLYSFRVGNIPENTSLTVLTIPGNLSPSEELAWVKDGISKHQNRLHILGVTSKYTCQYIEALYREQGFYRMENNRFAPDFARVGITFGTSLTSLWYGSNGPGSHGHGTDHAKALRGALNSGCISSLDIGQMDQEKAQTIMEFLLLEGVISPFRLGQVLYWNLVRIFGEDTVSYTHLLLHAAQSQGEDQEED